VSDPEVPTLADAAQAIVDWWDKLGTVGEPWQKIERLRAALGRQEPDTPAEDERAAWERMDRIIDGANPTRAVPATPEGGELDDLLRRATHWLEDEPDDVDGLVDDLASALRSQRGDTADLNRCCDGLERDLAEARGTADAMADLAAQFRNERDGLRRELAEVRDTPSGEVLFHGVVIDAVRPAPTRPVRFIRIEVEGDGGASLLDRRVVVRAAEDKETPT
jgi:hypothetical protein